MSIAANPVSPPLARIPRLRRTKALAWVYGYQLVASAIIALPLTTVLSQALAHFPKGDSQALQPGGLFLVEAWGQADPVAIAQALWSTVTWWCLLALGAQLPAVHWLRALLPKKKRGVSWRDYVLPLSQFVGVGVIASITRGLLWGFAYTSGLTIGTFLQHHPDKRFVDLMTWLPLLVMVPISQGVCALEGLTRLGIVAQLNPSAKHQTYLTGKPTASDALALALTVTRRHRVVSLGGYLAYRGVCLLAIVGGALAVSAVQAHHGESWRTGLCLIIHQAIVLTMLLLHARWQQLCMRHIGRAVRPF